MRRGGDGDGRTVPRVVVKDYIKMWKDPFGEFADAILVLVKNYIKMRKSGDGLVKEAVFSILHHKTVIIIGDAVKDKS